MAARVLVVGAGSWGTALANVSADAGNETQIWGRDANVLRELDQFHTNQKYLGKLPISDKIQSNSELEAAIKSNDVLIIAIPTQQIRTVFGPLAAHLSGKILVNASKGIEMGTGKRVSEIFAEISPGATYSVLSGPSFAEETVKRLPTAVTVACTMAERGSEIQSLFSTPYFRTYRSPDVVGVELGGSLKNVIAIASGIVGGLQLGYNAQAALINRGIAEIARIGKRLGADMLTFLGLSGMGDLVLTCTGPLSRNRKLGILLAEGTSLEDAKKKLGGVAEGAFTALSVRALAKRWGVEMPISDQVYSVVHDGKSARQAVQDLMSRELKAEWEGEF